MYNWSEEPADQLFRSGQEQPGSQNAYDRQLTIQHRRFQMEQQVADAQIKAAKATEKTARWTMASAIAVAASVLVALAAFLFS